MNIRFSISDKEVLSALRRFARSGTPSQLRPVMKEIGEVLAASTKRRFDTSTGPDGSRWEGLAQSTLLARLSGKTGDKKGYYWARGKNAGRITKKSAAVVMSMKPLIDTRELSTTIRYQVANGGAGVEIGTNRTFDESADVGAEVHQFGTRNGRIPARPFLGLSDSDKTTVLDTLARFIEGQLRP